MRILGVPARPLFLAVAALVITALVAGTLPTYPTGVLTDALIFAMLAVSLNLLLGHVGLPSLGHAAYFGIGAYTAGILSVHLTSNFWIGATAGIGTSALLGAVFGVIVLRTAGVYFLMITLALAQVVWAVAFSWRELTGGDDGLRGISRPDLMIPGFAVDDRYSIFLLVLVCLFVLMLLTYLLTRSPFGTVLRGIQESEVRMDALGYNVWLYKYIAFVIASATGGFAGVLFVYYKGFVSPEAISIVVSAEVMLMVILGGAGTLVGPLLGAVLIVLLSNVTSAYTDRWPFILGVLYVLVVLVAPHGILGATGSLFARWRRVRA